MLGIGDLRGCPRRDSSTWATYELAKWLLGVECYYLHSEARAEKVESLLWTFIQDRHNGYCSRIAEGRHEELRSQITRIISKAEEKSEEPFFQKLRHAYRQGYRKSWLSSISSLARASPTGILLLL